MQPLHLGCLVLLNTCLQQHMLNLIGESASSTSAQSSPDSAVLPHFLLQHHNLLEQDILHAESVVPS